MTVLVTVVFLFFYLREGREMREIEKKEDMEKNCFYFWEFSNFFGKAPVFGVLVAIFPKYFTKNKRFFPESKFLGILSGFWEIFGEFLGKEKYVQKRLQRQMSKKKNRKM